MVVGKEGEGAHCFLFILFIMYSFLSEATSSLFILSLVKRHQVCSLMPSIVVRLCAGCHRVAPDVQPQDAMFGAIVGLDFVSCGRAAS